MTEVPFGDVDAAARGARRWRRRGVHRRADPGQGRLRARRRDLARDARPPCTDAGALFICDEVQTGIGRTGTFYAYEHYGLSPDIITVSKALSGGYVPVGAMLTRDRIFRGVYSSMDRALVHSTTFKGNQLAMVAGLATLSVFDDEGIVEHAAAMGDVWHAATRRARGAPRVPPRRSRRGPDDRHRVRRADVAAGRDGAGAPSRRRARRCSPRPSSCRSSSGTGS